MVRRYELAWCHVYFYILCKYREYLNLSIKENFLFAEALEKRDGYSKWKENLLNLQIKYWLNV